MSCQRFWQLSRRTMEAERRASGFQYDVLLFVPIWTFYIAVSSLYLRWGICVHIWIASCSFINKSHVNLELERTFDFRFPPQGFAWVKPGTQQQELGTLQNEQQKWCHMSELYKSYETAKSDNSQRLKLTPILALSMRYETVQIVTKRGIEKHTCSVVTFASNTLGGANRARAHQITNAPWEESAHPRT